MKNIYKPMLFSTPMVEVILEDRKTQTRRTKGLELINERNDISKLEMISDPEKNYWLVRTVSSGTYKVDCPWNVGDILWVRETFFTTESYVGSDKPTFGYKANNDFIGCNNWKPSIHMPKKAARIFLKITGIRVERLVDISEGDAINEGLEFEIIDNIKEYKNYTRKSKEFSRYNDYSYPDSPRSSFLSLWESINGEESLGLNPWVWVIEFEKIDKPDDF